jgi:hypothetical protein
VGQLEAIPGGGQHHGMIADDIPSTDGMDTNLGAGTFSRHSNASVASILLIIKVISLI